MELIRSQIILLEYRRKKDEYHIGKNKDIPNDYDFAICGCGNGCLGKIPKYIGQYAEEIYMGA